MELFSCHPIGLIVSAYDSFFTCNRFKLGSVYRVHTGAQHRTGKDSIVFKVEDASVHPKDKSLAFWNKRK